MRTQAQDQALSRTPPLDGHNSAKQQPIMGQTTHHTLNDLMVESIRAMRHRQACIRAHACSRAACEKSSTQLAVCFIVMSDVAACRPSNHVQGSGQSRRDQSFLRTHAAMALECIEDATMLRRRLCVVSAAPTYSSGCKMCKSNSRRASGLIDLGVLNGWQQSSRPTYFHLGRTRRDLT